MTKKEQLIQYLKEHNLQFNLPDIVTVSTILNIPCITCQKITNKEVKYLLKTNRPPKCGKCAHIGQKAYNKGTGKILNAELELVLSPYGIVLPPNLTYQDKFNMGCIQCHKPTLKYVNNILRKSFRKQSLMCRSCSGKQADYVKIRKENALNWLNPYLKSFNYPELTTLPKIIPLNCFDCKVPLNMLLTNIRKELTKPPRCHTCAGIVADTPESRAKFKETMIERYGVENPFQHQETKLKAWETRRKNGSIKMSKQEKQITDFIKEILPNETILNSDRTILNGQELDVYIPSKALAIEYHGLYWHCELHKDRQYHFNKRQLADQANIRLLQFYGNEWNEKTNICKSIIKSTLNQFDHKYFGRKTIIKIPSANERKDFLTQNHLMGDFKSGKSVGLYIGDELISLIVYKRHGYGIDISRFCNKLNTTVIGGLSKLLKFIGSKENPLFIQSWVDLRYHKGSGLLAMGFEQEKITLGWRWTDFNDTYNRLSCRANMDERNLSEKGHSEELGYFKIYDAGQALYKKQLYQWVIS